MSAPVVFADLYKPVKDFFSKGFVAPGVRGEYKVKGSNGFLNVTASHPLAGDKLNTTAEYEQTCKCATTGFTTAKIVIVPAVVPADSRFQPSIKVKDFFNVKGLTVGVNADQSALAVKSNADKVEPFVEFVNANQFSKVTYNLNTNAVEGSVTVAVNKLLVGGSAKLIGGGLSSFTTGASYKTPLFSGIGTYTQVLKDKSFTATAGALYLYKKYIFGAQVTQTAKGSAILVGTETTCQGVTYRAKFNNKGVISASAQNKFGRFVVTAGGDVDPTKAQFSNVGIKFVAEE